MERLNPSLPPLAERTSVFGFLGLVSLALLIAGGLNWALVGLLDLDLVAALFGSHSTAARVVYVLIGAAGIFSLAMLPRMSRLQ